jgi:uncharacterized ParB-like nuclease family protein
MCKSVAQGGQRCANHTRGPYLAAFHHIARRYDIDFQDLKNLEATALDYAGTPEGQIQIAKDIAETPFSLGVVQATLKSALRQGNIRIQSTKEGNALFASLARSSQLKAKTELSWDEVADQVPVYADDDGIHHAAIFLAYASEENLEPNGEAELVFALREIPLEQISQPRLVGQENPRVSEAIRGYTEKADVPPVVLIHRSGVYHLADGNHRLSAAKHAGKNTIMAFVAESPITDPLPQSDL